MLREIGEWIEDETTLVVGTDLFTGHRTEDAPDDCTLLLASAPSTTPDQFDLPDRVDFSLQVLTRGTSYFTTEAKAIEVYDILKSTEGITLPNITGDTILVQVSEAVDYPRFIGQTERGLFEFSTNYILRIKKN